MPASFAPLLATLFASTAILMLLRQKKQEIPYPPGPPPKPMIGNVLDMSLEKPWVKYFDLSKRYNSDIIHLSVMNTHIIILHKMKDVVALMEKRSTVYSGRPLLPIFQLLGVGDLTPTIHYGNDWRKHRKLFRECLGKELVPSYEDIMQEKVALMLELLLNEPEEFREHCQWFGSAIVMGMAFGYDVVPGQKDDRFVKLAEETAQRVARLALPESTLINVLPFLGHIPPWVPGASTQKEAAEIRSDMKAYKNEPFDHVVRNLAAGNFKECMLANLLQHRTKVGEMYEDEEIIKNMIATTYMAGVETTQITQANFFLTMALHPSQQKRAQEEIDRVVGTERLPTFKDRASLPYVEALLREMLRWRLVLPLGIAHCTVDDDVYNGFYIPKGSIVLANCWGLTRDETKYPDPESFKPERFLNPDGTLNDDNMELIFGFGRR
ncbi:hypothetical protein AX15_004069 [Amanita polypyramis BW_CC]|nr:hypothetical protein AX15_004069 [Amanita polypyramis BW_CC]